MKEVFTEFARTAAAVIAQRLQNGSLDEGPDGCSTFKATIGLELLEDGETPSAAITLSNEPDQCLETDSHYSFCGRRNGCKINKDCRD